MTLTPQGTYYWGMEDYTVYAEIIDKGLLETDGQYQKAPDIYLEQWIGEEELEEMREAA